MVVVGDVLEDPDYSDYYVGDSWDVGSEVPSVGLEVVVDLEEKLREIFDDQLEVEEPADDATVEVFAAGVEEVIEV